VANVRRPATPRDGSKPWAGLSLERQNPGLVQALIFTSSMDFLAEVCGCPADRNVRWRATRPSPHRVAPPLRRFEAVCTTRHNREGSQVVDRPGANEGDGGRPFGQADGARFSLWPLFGLDRLEVSGGCPEPNQFDQRSCPAERPGGVQREGDRSSSFSNVAGISLSKGRWRGCYRPRVRLPPL